MNILLTNDDGIFSPGLWTLAGALKKAGNVTIVAPDREQSATGTMVTLRIPLRVMKLECFDTDIPTYTVEGSPSDNVILALGKMVPDTKMVVSGINQGLNLGDDVLISGTVGAALQGYLRGLPALAVSVPPESKQPTYQIAAQLASIITSSVNNGYLGNNGFFNINVPAVPLEEIRGIKVTSLAHKTHIDSVNEGYDGRREYYWLVRQQLSADVPEDTDIWAIENNYISITALHSFLFHRPDGELNEPFCQELFNTLVSK